MAVMFDKDHFVDDRSLSVSVKNKGLNYGLGCIDGIRAFWNAGQEQLLLFRLDDHLKRFEQSGESLFIKNSLFHRGIIVHHKKDADHQPGDSGCVYTSDLF